MQPERFSDDKKEGEEDESTVDIRSRQCPYLDTINRHTPSFFT